MTQTAHTLRLIDEFLTQGGHAHGIDADALEREAALVAAAPDLLAALKAIEQLANAFRFESDADVFRFIDNIRAAIADAIAKATGEDTET